MHHPPFTATDTPLLQRVIRNECMQAHGDFPRWRRNAISPTGHDELHAYDRLHRLVEMARGTLSTDRQHVDDMQFTQDWTLDPTGNWNRFTQTLADEPAENLDQSRWQNAANEITRIARRYGPDWATPQYDRAGNMTVIPKSANPTTTFTGTYDAWNRLVHLSDIDATYRYDAFNRRVTTLVDSTVRHFYYTADWQCLEERLDASPTPDRQYLWGLRYIDDLVLRDRDTNSDGDLDERLYALQDANWNVTAICDTSGQIQERYAYTPYGVPTVLAPNFTLRGASDYAWNTLYAGYRWDVESGLYQVRMRFLNCVLGLWLSRDPLGYGATVSLYAYSSQQPTSETDPWGLFPWPASSPPRDFGATNLSVPQVPGFHASNGGLGQPPAIPAIPKFSPPPIADIVGPPPGTPRGISFEPGNRGKPGYVDFMQTPGFACLDADKWEAAKINSGAVWIAVPMPPGAQGGIAGLRRDPVQVELDRRPQQKVDYEYYKAVLKAYEFSREECDCLRRAAVYWEGKSPDAPGAPDVKKLLDAITPKN